MLHVWNMTEPTERSIIEPNSPQRAEATLIDSLYEAIAEQELCSNLKAMLERYDLDSMPHLKRAVLEIQAQAMDADERMSKALEAIESGSKLNEAM